jgi:6-pyruvoyl-tetrahydropterin synthase
VYRVTKRSSFTASHSSIDPRSDQPGAMSHEHTFAVYIECEVARLLPQTGLAMDPRVFDVVQHWIQRHLHGQDLNAVCTFDITGVSDFKPTPEMLAEMLYHKFHTMIPELTAVSVEMDEMRVRYQPS